jgi:hypothetical protein
MGEMGEVLGNFWQKGVDFSAGRQTGEIFLMPHMDKLLKIIFIMSVSYIVENLGNESTDPKNSGVSNLANYFYRRWDGDGVTRWREAGCWECTSEGCSEAAEDADMEGHK